MLFLHLFYFLVGAASCIFFIVFAVESIRENKRRAVAFSLLFGIVIAALWIGWFMLFSGVVTLVLPPVATILFGLAFFLPIGKVSSLVMRDTGERMDERDVVFAREEYAPETTRYEEYYGSHPELKSIDDKIRCLPELLQPGAKFYDPVVSPRVDSVFEEIECLTTKVDGDVAGHRKALDPAKATTDIKQLVLEMGADEVGIARLNKAHIYSHVGRGPEEYGKLIENNHNFAIAFTVEMRYEKVEQAPYIGITGESADRYLRAARISIELAGRIRAMGYPARAHIAGSNYQIILPAVAHDAGLGELGRHGYLISRRFGSRVRLGAVTTDIPLITDRPITFGVQDFCDVCLKCATACPSASIPKGEKTAVRGVEKWLLHPESCLHYWRTIGTDCGLCMKVCPYSHPSTFVHRVIRAGISRSAFARRVSAAGDTLFYGKGTFNSSMSPNTQEI